MSYLRDIKDKVIADVIKNEKRIEQNRKMIKAVKGNLDPLYYEAISNICVPQHKIDLTTFKTHVNPYQKIINKLSNNYSFKTERIFKIKSGTNALQFYDDIRMQKVFLEMNKYANVSQYSVVKLKFNKKKGIIQALPLSADQFWLYTDDVYNPAEPKVYVQFIEDLLTKDMQKRGISWAKSFYLYTDDERLEVSAYIDKQGLKVNDDENDSGINLLGFAPFILCTYDSTQLIPELNTSDYSFAARIPVLYSEICVAIHYLSNPLAVFKNIDTKKSQMAMNPASSIVLNAREGSDASPELQFISPNLDITQGLNFIANLVSEHMFSKGVPVKKEGVVDMSGLAMLIDGGDTLEARKAQMPYLATFEEEFWNKLGKYHNYILSSEDKNIYKAPSEFVDADFKMDINFTLPSIAAEQINATEEDSDIVDTTEIKGE